MTQRIFITPLSTLWKLLEFVLFLQKVPNGMCCGQAFANLSNWKLHQNIKKSIISLKVSKWVAKTWCGRISPKAKSTTLTIICSVPKPTFSLMILENLQLKERPAVIKICISWNLVHLRVVRESRLLGQRPRLIERLVMLSANTFRILTLSMATSMI